MSMKKKAVVIGAGMAGCFMAVCLAKRGFVVEVYEYRPDVRQEPFDSGRSFNLTLYYRGIEAMKKVGMWEEAKKVAVIAEGNVAHYEKKNVYDSFDAAGNEILYTVHRNNLNGALIDAAEKYDNITFHFHAKCIEINDKEKYVLIETKTKDKVKTTKVPTDLVVGADGVNSTVRNWVSGVERDLGKKEYEDWGYKEVHISPTLTKKMDLRTKATHTWPRPDSLLIAFPNPDDSFTLMFNLQLEGEKSFTTLTTEEKIRDFIQTDFPDLTPLIPEIVHAFQNKKTGTFVTLKNPVWHDKNFMLLIGDAAHAFIPFYGQGMCAAFDDCLKFSELFDIYGGNLEKVFPLYQDNRKRNTDLMAELARENFIELRDKSRSPYYVLKDKTDTLLHMILPGFWQPPLYVLIAHGDMEYYDAYTKYQKQQKLSKKIGLDLALKAVAYSAERFMAMKSK